MTNKVKNSINQTIWKLINSDLAIQKDLQRQIINMRALAKYLIKKNCLNYSLDAAISSIRRYESEEEFKEEEKQLSTIFKDAVISTKNNISCITARLSSKELLKKLSVNNLNANFRMIVGKEELKIMAEQPEIDKIKRIFTKEEIIKIEDDLSEVAVKVARKALGTKGVLARISNQIALANINIQETIICPPEFFIYVKEKDIVKTHESIIKLTQEV